MMLVTLQQASDHLRRDTDADDADLSLKVLAASSAVLAYLKSRRNLYVNETDENGDDVLDSAGLPIPAVDSAGEMTVRYNIQAATLLMLGYLYRDRDADSDKAYQQGYLPAPVTALLYPLRDPALA